MLPRLLLVITSPAQWSDHVQEYPLNQTEAYSRYHLLSWILQTILKGRHKSLVPYILSSMFHIPSPWLPDNVGCVLWLLDQVTSLAYLHHNLHNNSFQDVSTGIIGLIIMTVKCGVDPEPVLAMMEEGVVMKVPEEHRVDILRAIWKALAEEVADIRQSEGEDWATESSMHHFKVIRLIGQRMTERAFLDLPTTGVQETDLGIEE